MLQLGDEVLDKFMGVADTVIRPYEMVMLSSINHGDYFPHYVKFDGVDHTKIKGMYLYPFLWSPTGEFPSIEAQPGDLIYCKEYIH